MTKVALHRTHRPTRASPSRAIWQLRWYGPSGKRYGETLAPVGEMTKREAQRICRVKQSKLDGGVIRADKPRPVALAEWLKIDRESIQADVRASTLLEYDHAAKHVLAALGGRTRLAHIGRAEVGRVKRYLQELGRRPATIKKTVVALAAIMRRAKEDGLVMDNPFAGAAKGKTQSRRKRIFTGEEVDAMLAVAPTLWWSAFIRLAVTTGLRRNELLNLLWSDVDVDGGVVTVTRKDAARFTVGDREYPILPWQTKAAEERQPPAPEATLSALQRLHLTSGGSPYLFLSLERLATLDRMVRAGTWTDKTILINNLPRGFEVIQRHARARLAGRRGVEVCKVDWAMGTVHDLRRTYATEMATHVGILDLCRWMGHADPKTTAGFYHAVQPATEDRARAAMAAAYGAETDTQRTPNAPHAVPSANGAPQNRGGATMNAESARSSVG